MEADRVRWNRRYGAERVDEPHRPAVFLAEEIDRILGLAPGRRALDVACGEGCNCIFLARHGFRVTGVDVSDVGLSLAERRAEAAGVTVSFLRRDLEEPLDAGRFDLIVNINFLLRGLIPSLYASLVPGGVMLFESLLEPDPPGDHNPAFYLKPGELKRLFQPHDGRILRYDESPGTEPATARILFLRPA